MATLELTGEALIVRPCKSRRLDQRGQLRVSDFAPLRTVELRLSPIVESNCIAGASRATTRRHQTSTMRPNQPAPPAGSGSPDSQPALVPHSPHRGCNASWWFHPTFPLPMRPSGVPMAYASIRRFHGAFRFNVCTGWWAAVRCSSWIFCGTWPAPRRPGGWPDRPAHPPAQRVHLPGGSGDPGPAASARTNQSLLVGSFEDLRPPAQRAVRWSAAGRDCTGADRPAGGRVADGYGRAVWPRRLLFRSHRLRAGGLWAGRMSRLMGGGGSEPAM
jgi:hypothetical protein